ncbi:MAG: type II toxin-antitoxin system prevent-host-death family antitoxin [Bryobacterales bacterium]|nr:type II toxin-antitoxin system prevent-host-death family antitoxin [Bryobacterales bacterium]
MNATIVDLRYHMKDVLRAIDRGETVTILHRGKPKARLMPINPAGTTAPSVVSQPLFGLWSKRDDMEDPTAYVRNLRQPRAVRSK